MTNIRRGREAREKRREAANKRSGDYELTDAATQLNILDNRLGVGVGAAKERARLAKQIAKGNKK
jgi:hypothetical protein